jgi:RNase P/RNase MRP subunit p29
VKNAKTKGRRIALTGASYLIIGDSIATIKTNMAAITALPQPKSPEPDEAAQDEGTLKNLPGDDSTIPLAPRVADEERNMANETTDSACLTVPKQSQEPQTGTDMDLEIILRQQPKLVFKSSVRTEGTDITLEQGDVLVLEPEEKIEVKAGGIPVTVHRYPLIPEANN